MSKCQQGWQHQVSCCHRQFDAYPFNLHLGGSLPSTVVENTCDFLVWTVVFYEMSLVGIHGMGRWRQWTWGKGIWRWLGRRGIGRRIRRQGWWGWGRWGRGSGIAICLCTQVTPVFRIHESLKKLSVTWRRTLYQPYLIHCNNFTYTQYRNKILFPHNCDQPCPSWMADSQKWPCTRSLVWACFPCFWYPFYSCYPDWHVLWCHWKVALQPPPCSLFLPDHMDLDPFYMLPIATAVLMNMQLSVSAFMVLVECSFAHADVPLKFIIPRQCQGGLW
jgi:hypothetical protein